MNDKASFQIGSGKEIQLTVFRSTITMPFSKQGTAYTSRSVSRGSNGHGVLSLINGKRTECFAGTKAESLQYWRQFLQLSEYYYPFLLAPPRLVHQLWYLHIC
jgi:hypothetical protein